LKFGCCLLTFAAWAFVVLASAETSSKPPEELEFQLVREEPLS